MAKITLCKWCVNKSLMGFVPKGCSPPSTDGVGATLNFFAIFLPVFPLKTILQVLIRSSRFLADIVPSFSRLQRSVLCARYVTWMSPVKKDLNAFLNVDQERSVLCARYVTWMSPVKKDLNAFLNVDQVNTEDWV